MTRINLILFDLDGTLIDSRDDIVANVNRALQALGRPAFPIDRVGKCIGRGIQSLFRQLVGEDASPELIEALVSEFRKNYWRHLTDHTLVYPGVKEALEHYANRPKVVVTNKSQDFADAVVDQLGLRRFFAGIFGSDAFPTQKPDPGPIVEICSRWKTARGKTALMGDSTVDITAGKAAGVVTVAALYGYGDREAILRLRPDFTISSANELIGLLD